MTSDTIDTAAKIIQLALTPVFLLSGIAALLNVFASRLGRVGDQATKLASEPQNPMRDATLRVLTWRSRSLDCAVLLAAVAGASTCGAAIALFLGEVLGHSAANTLFILFGGALVLSMGALVAFVIEMLLAAKGVRRLVDHSVRTGSRPS